MRVPIKFQAQNAQTRAQLDKNGPKSTKIPKIDPNWPILAPKIVVNVFSIFNRSRKLKLNVEKINLIKLKLISPKIFYLIKLIKLKIKLIFNYFLNFNLIK